MGCDGGQWAEIGWLAGSGEEVENRTMGGMEMVGRFDGNGVEDGQWGVGLVWWRR